MRTKNKKLIPVPVIMWKAFSLKPHVYDNGDPTWGYGTPFGIPGRFRAQDS